MTVWDPARYLAFAGERSRPFLDLVAQVGIEARSVVDLGCGPGHLMPVLLARWPSARIVGVDSSPEMIERARVGGVPVDYVLADVATWQPDEPVDLIVSNALFQWVPRQYDVITALAEHVSPGGVFALQVPRNHEAPSHTLLEDLAGRPAYARHTAGADRVGDVDPMRYLELFAGLGWSVDVWETTYMHVLAGEDPVFTWISGTGARPVLQSLPEDLRDEFVVQYKAALREAYPPGPHGTVLPFTRTFAVARRPSRQRGR